MKINKFIVLTIVLLAIISLGAVSAQDTSSDDVKLVDDNTFQLELKNDDLKLSDDSSQSENNYSQVIYVSPDGDDSGSGSEKSPYASINRAVSDVDASENSVIYLGEGTFLGEDNVELFIDFAHKSEGGSLTIIGKGDGKTIIDANDESPVFRSIGYDSIVTLINITFINGRNDLGSVIYNEGGDLTIDSCVFENNTAETYAAVYQDLESNVKITNSKFKNNKGIFGGCADIYICIWGSEEQVILENCLFEDVSASEDADWIDSSSVKIISAYVSAQGNTFSKISGFDTSSALYVSSENYAGDVFNNTFIDCSNYREENGAILAIGNCNIGGNTFKNCTTMDDVLILAMGNIGVTLNFDDVNITKTSFSLRCNVTDNEGNRIKSYDSVKFYLNDTYVGEGKISGGLATLNSLKLLDNGQYVITGSYGYENPFECTVINGAATVDIDRTPIELWVSTEGNDEKGNGSVDNPFKTLYQAIEYGLENSIDITIHMKNGIYNETGDYDLSYNDVVKLSIIGETYENVIIDGLGSNRFFNLGENVISYFKNLKFINGACEGFDEVDGIFVLTPSSFNVCTLEMEDCIIDNSGEFYTNYDSPHVILRNVSWFNSNQIKMSNPEIYDSHFENITAYAWEGCLWLNGRTNDVIIQNSKFINLICSGYGGVAYVGGSLRSINNTFDSNQAGNGGVFHLAVDKFLSINDTFTNNVAEENGGVLEGQNGQLSISVINGKFVNNRAIRGGALYINTGEFINCTFENNVAEYGGAIYAPVISVYNPDRDISLENTTFKDNNADYGKDIYIPVPDDNYVKNPNLKGIIVKFNDLTVDSLQGIVIANVTHDSGAVISGGFVTFYLNSTYMGKVEVVEGQAALDYLGFKNGIYSLSGEYSLAADDAKYEKGIVTVALKPLKDNVTLYVSDSKGDDENGDGSLDNPYKTIKTALNNAYRESAVIVIRVLEGTYSNELDTNLNVPGSLDISFIGDGQNVTVIDGQDINWFVNVLSGEGIVKITNMTISNISKNYADAKELGQMSAITINEDATVLIDGVGFIRCHGSEGGAIYSEGNLSVSNSYFFNNGDSTYGAAIKSYGTLTVDKSEFIANHAKYYSTIFSGGDLFISNSLFRDCIRVSGWTGNYAAIGGEGNITLVNSTFSRSGKGAIDIIGMGQTYWDVADIVITIGSTESIKLIDCVFDGFDENLESSVAFGTTGSLGTWSPKSVEIINTELSNIKYLFFGGNTLLDSCHLENISYLYTGQEYGNYVLDNCTMVNSYIADGTIKASEWFSASIVTLLNNNWWGNNSQPIYNVLGEDVSPDNWLILTLEQNGDEIKLAFKVFDGENTTDYDSSLYPRDFTLNATNVVLGITNGTINNMIVSPIISSDSNYAISATVDNETITLGVIKLNTLIDIISVKNDLSIDAKLTDVNGNPIANATIDYEIAKMTGNITTDENGEFNIPCLANGEMLISYNGTGKFSALNKTFIFNGVIKKDVEIKIDAPKTVNAGGEAIIVVNIENATGNVSLFIDGVENILKLDNYGVVTYTMEDIASGEHTIVAVYDGDNNIAPTASSKTINAVKKASSADIEISDDIKIGGDVVVTVNIDDAEGNVSIIVDGSETIAQLINGFASVPIEATAGDHSVVVVYSGDDTHEAVYDSKTFSVPKETSQANVTIGDIAIGKDTNVSVSIPGATGNVSVIVDGVEKVVPLENGTAVVPIEAVGEGEHSVVVVYTGDDAHDAVYKATSFNVEVFATEFTNITVNGNGFIDAVLVNSLGDAMANTTVYYTLDGVKYNTTTDETGAFIINVTGSTVVEMSYEGTDFFLPSNVSIKLENIAPTRDSTIILGNNYTQYAIEYSAGERGQNFTVQLVDEMGNPIANKTVLIGYNGKTLERTTNATGHASVQINLKDKNRLTFAATFLGDKDYNATMSVYLITIEQKPVTITAAAKTYKATAKTKKYTVTLKTIKGASADGKTYFAAGKKVTMKINGKTYTAKTNAKGQATFSLKITKKGKYTAKINYAGDNTYKAASKSVKITIN